MADNITLKRIVDLVAQTDVDETVYTIIDSVAGTVKKYPIGSLICSIAPIFDSTADYLAGAYCNYNGQLYVFTADHDAGAWTGSDVSTVTLTDIAEAHGGDLAELEAAVTALETALDGKADSAGVYENLTAGNALQLASNTGTENSEPYFFRPVPADATREEVEVVGGSVVWNQLAPQSAEDPAWTEGAVSVTWIGSDATITCTNDETTIKRWSHAITANHVWLAMADMKGTVLTRLGFFNSSSHAELAKVSVDAGGSYEHKAIIYKPTAGSYAGFRLPNTASTSDYANAKHVQLIDLTALLGPTIADYIYTLEQATAGAGVAWFQKYFGTDYKEYSAPTIKSVEGVSAHRLTGKNLLDPALVKTQSTWNLITLNVEPNTAYVASTDIPSSSGLYVYFNNDGTSGGSTLTNVYEGNPVSVTSTADGKVYIAQRRGSGSDEFANRIIQVEKGTTPTKLEPYTAHTYAMDDSKEWRGIFKIDANGNLYADGDVYHPNGVVDRNYKLINLGNLAWTYDTTNTAFIYQGDIGADTTGEKVTCLCAKYIAIANIGSLSGAAGKPDKTIFFYHNATPSNRRLIIKDSAYTDADVFKASLENVYALAKLATPTTESATPYTTPQICAPGGTEEWVTTGVVPVGHRTWYPTNQVGKLDGLPANFSTLIAPTEKTTTASRAYSIGDYFILNNTLYKVVSGIASGGTITPGTNCTATTIMAEIAAL